MVRQEVEFSFEFCAKEVEAGGVGEAQFEGTGAGCFGEDFDLSELGEGKAVATALTSLAQQPDASATITRTLFVGLAMIESIAIYCFVISMILIFANPFWNHVIAQTAGK